MHFKVLYKKLGGHVHVRLFSAPAANQTHGKNGDLVFREEEWEPFLRCFQGYRSDQVMVLPED